MKFNNVPNIKSVEQINNGSMSALANGHSSCLVLVVSFCHLLNDICTGALPGMIPFLVSQYSCSYAMASLLMLTSHCISAISQPFFGYLGDKHPCPWSMAVGVALSSCGVCSMCLSDNFIFLIFCAALIGFGSSIFHPEGGRLANLASGIHKSKGLSYFSVGGNMGYSLGPIVFSLSFMLLGQLGTILFAPIGIIAIALVLLNKNSLSFLEVEESKHNNVVHLKNDVKGFAMSLIAITQRSCIHNAMLLLIPLFFMDNLGKTDSFSSMMLSTFGFCALTATFFGGFIAEKVGYKTMLLLSFALYIPFILIFTTSSNVATAIVFMLLIGLSGNLSWSSGTAYVQQFLPRNLGMASGLIFGLSVCVGSASSTLFGAIADNIGISNTLFFVVIVAVAGILFTLTVPRKNRFIKD